MQPVLGDHMQVLLLHCLVFAGVVSNTTLVDVMRHCVITGPPENKTERMSISGQILKLISF